MNLDESQIRSVVENVVRNLSTPSAPAIVSANGSAGHGDDGIFETLEEAVSAAKTAQRDLEALSLETRRAIIDKIRETSLAHAQGISQQTREETGMGRVPHKIRKFEVVARETPGVEDIEQTAWTGDHGLTVIEMAPFGVVAAVTPSTHPVPTTVNNAISLISAGNSVVFAPHPSARNISTVGIQLLNRGIVEAGGPPNLQVAVREPSIETAQALFTHEDVDLLLVTGGGGVVKAAMSAPKRAICAGPGNPPVVVDETADLAKAAFDTIQGGAFDNNILCIGEKEVFVVASVADEFKRQVLTNNTVELDRGQIQKLTSLAFPTDESGNWSMNREFVGRNASVLADAVGLSISDDVDMLVGEVEYGHPFVMREQMMPFLPIVRVPDVDTGIDMAVEAEHGYRHTAVMHSKNVEHMTTMARKCKCTLFIKNGASTAGLGVGGEGYTSFSIATPTGEGVTSARTFPRQRRCTLVDYFRIV
ncbi:MAG: aldehyde dehydrogenase EutE [Gemmatimonadetes bacterium]|nr:aldehyde dehydrogenase EutE [Gemmatimonadota bacterium]